MVSSDDLEGLGEHYLPGNKYKGEKRNIYLHKTSGELYYKRSGSEGYRLLSELGISESDISEFADKISNLEGKTISTGMLTSPDIGSKCELAIKKHKFFKEQLLVPILYGAIRMLENPKHLDNVFYKAAKLIINVPAGRDDIPKYIRLQNLNAFVFADQTGNFTKQLIAGVPKIHVVIYLTLITVNKLISGKRTEESTYNQILEYMGYTGIKKYLPSVEKIKAGMKFKWCEKKEEGTGLIGSIKYGYTCSETQWASVYSTFDNRKLRMAVQNILFS